MKHVFFIFLDLHHSAAKLLAKISELIASKYNACLVSLNRHVDVWSTEFKSVFPRAPV